MERMLLFKAKVLVRLMLLSLVMGFGIGLLIGGLKEPIVIEKEVEIEKHPILVDSPTIAEEETIVEITPIYELTSQERIWVEQVVASEARGESIEGIMAVAQTIRDRAVGWDQSVQEVLFAPSQYANPYSGPIDMKVREAVSRVFDDNESIYEEPITHFYNYTVCDPWWSQSKKEQGKIGNHVFLSSIYGG